MRSGADVAVETVMTALMSGVAIVLLLAMGAGCIAYRAPVVVFQRGPETNYNQERSGVQARSTTAEQQVAETTAEQDQQANQTDAAMSSAVDETKQVGLKQGQAATGTQTPGRDNVAGSTAGTTQSPTGQEGGDAAAIGQTPTAAGGGGGQGGSGGTSTGGTTTDSKEASAAEPAAGGTAAGASATTP
jgi:hypothetical protein